MNQILKSVSIAFPGNVFLNFLLVVVCVKYFKDKKYHLKTHEIGMVTHAHKYGDILDKLRIMFCDLAGPMLLMTVPF